MAVWILGHSSWTDCPSNIRAPITVIPISSRIRLYSVYAWPAFWVFTALILGPHPPPAIRPVAVSTTETSGGSLLRKAYPPLPRSEEHTSELQSQSNLVCRLLLEKKKKKVTTR